MLASARRRATLKMLRMISTNSNSISWPKIYNKSLRNAISHQQMHLKPSYRSLISVKRKLRIILCLKNRKLCHDTNPSNQIYFTGIQTTLLYSYLRTRVNLLSINRPQTTKVCIINRQNSPKAGLKLHQTMNFIKANKNLDPNPS